MADYAAQVSPRDRWAIAAYIRVLQFSQQASLQEVPPENRQELNGMAAAFAARRNHKNEHTDFTISAPLTRNLERVQQRSLIVGAVALLHLRDGAVFTPQQFFRSYP